MNDRILRPTSAIFLAAVLVHGADHIRRGTDAVTTQVLVAGTVQFVLAAVTVALVFRRHRLAPVAAIVVGFASAAGFAAAHLLPNWGEFSDAFTGSQTGPEVTAFSWFTALFEIVADITFAWAGVVVLRRRATETVDTGDAVSVA